MDNNELLQAISIMMDNKLDKMFDEKLNNVLDEKLQPIMDKIEDMQDDITVLKHNVKQLNKKVDKLERNDKFILDEIERVHEQLIDHIKDNSKHIA